MVIRCWSMDGWARALSRACVAAFLLVGCRGEALDPGGPSGEDELAAGLQPEA